MASAFDDQRAALEKHEFMLGIPRGRLAVTLDMITDAIILVGQHGVYCTSARNLTQPALDLQTVMQQLTGAKELIQSVMQELSAKPDSK